MGKFPDGFLWGAATAAHQVEGGNRNDWSEWEKQNAERLAREAERKFGHLPNWNDIKIQAQNPANYISSRACDHYNRYEADFDIAKSLGHTAHRFSLEWSRIEPEEGKWDEKEIEHYRKVIHALRARGIEPFVTLWHWTNPVWIRNMGGWENKKTEGFFLRYVEKIIEEFGNEIHFWLVINEPNIYAGMSYVQGDFPPCVRNMWRANRVMQNLVRTNNRAYVLLHEKLGNRIMVGSAHNLISHLPYNKDSLLDKLSSWFLNNVRNFRSFGWARGHQDFIGINYYHLEKIQFVLFGKRRWYFFRTHVNQDNVTDMNWEIYPEGIYNFLLNMKKYKLPIFITENGLADTTDDRREDYIKSHLQWVHKAISEGADVRGYLYWSLLDNFEWDKGFWPRFGLVEVDYKTMERRIRPSAYAYANICKENAVT
ncbi:MAG: glycoside hydrolase family 1 protein [Patescibacteria group bacterium]